MTKEDCYLVGKLTKTHGLKGEMAIWLDVDYPEEYEDLESILVEMKGELIPYFVEQIQIRANKSIIKFEDVDSKALDVEESILKKGQAGLFFCFFLIFKTGKSICD